MTDVIKQPRFASVSSTGKMSNKLLKLFAITGLFFLIIFLIINQSQMHVIHLPINFSCEFNWRLFILHMMAVHLFNCWNSLHWISPLNWCNAVATNCVNIFCSFEQLDSFVPADNRVTVVTVAVLSPPLNAMNFYLKINTTVDKIRYELFIYGTDVNELIN